MVTKVFFVKQLSSRQDNMKIVRKSDCNFSDWNLFFSSFLDAAVIIFEEVEKNGNKSLLVVAFYNIKHGIEVFLKAIKIDYEGLLDKKDNTHNLGEIVDSYFLRLEKDISDNKDGLRLLIKENSDIDSDGKKDLMSFVENPSKEMAGLREKILMFYRLDFVKNKIAKEDFFVQDVDNTFFRYPKNNLEIIVKDYRKLVESFTREEILRIKSESLILDVLLCDIYILVSSIEKIRTDKLYKRIKIS